MSVWEKQNIPHVHVYVCLYTYMLYVVRMYAHQSMLVCVHTLQQQKQQFHVAFREGVDKSADDVVDQHTVSHL